METLNIAGTQSLPKVNFDLVSNMLELSGRSIPEHPEKFYRPLDDWLKAYLLTTPKETELKIYLDYLNTHSTECLLLLLRKLEVYKKSSGAHVVVSWLFDEDDEDMEGLGGDLASLVDLSFNLVEVKDED